jgi:predicted permease
VNRFRYALRSLRRDRGYAALAILTMAIGIGATTTIFSVVYGVLMKPLPFREANRIVRPVETRAGHEARLPGTIGNGVYFAWRDHPTTIEAIGGYGVGTNTVTAVRGRGEPVRLRVTAMTPSAFAVLEAPPFRGRLFTDDEVPAPGMSGVDTPRPVLISYALWRDWFAGHDNALGTVIRLDDVPHTIVGVMPPSFAFPDADTRAWTPMPVPPVVPIGWDRARSIMIFGGLARLKPGVSPEQAAAEGTARARQAPDPGFAAVGMFGSNAPSSISVTPLARAMTADVRPALLVMLAAVGLLLATAVANVGGLQLARASTRRREMAVRAALGAEWTTLVRELLAESTIIAAAGGVGGVAAALALSRMLPVVLPADFPRISDVAVNVPVLGFVVLVLFVASIGTSLMPATLTRRLNLTGVLASESTASVAGVWRSSSGRMRSLVMTVQVAVACVLLVGAVLLTRSFLALLHADRGYDPSSVLTARLDLPQRADGQTHARLADAVIDRLRRTPGVTHVAAGSALPFMSLGTALASELPSPTDPGVMVPVHGNLLLVSPDYFAALGLPLLEGRLLTDADGGTSTAIVVSRSFAGQYLGDNAIGKTVPIGFTKDLGTDWQVVGIVGDMRQGSVTASQTPQVFITYHQVSAFWVRSSIHFAVRATGDPMTQIAPLRAAVHQLDPTLAVDSIMTMEERIGTSLAKPRLYAMLLGAFAVAAVAIAGIGLFGILSYGVAQRSREIGVRTAVGAGASDIIALVLKDAVVIGLAGVTLGLSVAYGLTRYLGSFLYGVGRTDAASYIVVAAAVALVASAACIVPARRAARIDPLVALRAQ